MLLAHGLHAGIMPIMTYGGFKRMTGFCKTRIPAEILEALEAIKDNDEAVKVGGEAQCSRNTMGWAGVLRSACTLGAILLILFGVLRRNLASTRALPCANASWSLATCMAFTCTRSIWSAVP